LSGFIDFLLLDARVFDPVPDLCSKVALADVGKELDAFEGINLCLFALVTLHSKQNHA